MASSRQQPRPRRVDDALSQLVDSLTPALPISAVQDEENYSEVEEALAAAEQRRHRIQLERAWRILDSHSNTNATDPSSPAGLGGRRGSLAGTENVNNAPDLIKRKLRRENASPDKAVRFSNLYSRLLTQPVLSQKWGTLYLLYKLSGNDEGALDGDGSRSPFLEEGNSRNMLGRDTSRPRRGTNSRAIESEDDDGPAVSSSASQRVPVSSRSERHEAFPYDSEHDGAERAAGGFTERVRSRASNHSSATTDHSNNERGDAPSPTLTPMDRARSVSVEHGLLHDLPFNLQGLSSSNLKFESATSLKLPATLPSPIISLLHSLAEPCLLYKELATFVESTDGGLVNQSLRAAIADELRSYLSLVATLEAEIRQALAAIGDGKELKGVRKGGVTLKRCMVWTRDATMALRLMSLIVEEARGKSPER